MLRESERLRRLEGRYSNARLAVFGIGVLNVTAAIWADFPWWPILLPIAVFIALAYLHEGAIRARETAEAIAAYSQRAVRRLNGTWAGDGPEGTEHAPQSHIFAGDIDLVGHGSLYQLLCSARTHFGQARLFNMLSAPVPIERMRERQEAAQELARRHDLRERLAIAGETARAIETAPLIAWAEREAAPGLRRIIPFAWVLTVSGALSLALPLIINYNLWPLPLLMLTVNALATGVLAPYWRPAAKGLDASRHAVNTLAPYLAIIEAESVRAPLLTSIKRQLEEDDGLPSKRIEQLNGIVRLLDMQGNQLFALAGLILLWPVHVSHALDTWRLRHGRRMAPWLEAAGHFEALAAISGFAFERPAYAWPEGTPEGPRFEAEALAHPLLPSSGCVANDLRLDAAQRLLIVTGSNMSGKSTLLRAAGLTLCLARAGAPVRAKRLTLSNLRLGAAMRVQDSIQQGHSRFYAEINRLKQIVDSSEGDAPVLFLLDEILSSTNSHDRKAGAEAVVRTLVERGSIGLVTSHDLAIAELEHLLAPHARNVHFQDEIADGRLQFDYKLREGVVQKSNAVALMRSIGLDI